MLEKDKQSRNEQETAVLEFLGQFGPALNISGLEKHLGLPFRSIRDWRNGVYPLAQKHLDAIEAWAKTITYKNDAE